MRLTALIILLTPFLINEVYAQKENHKEKIGSVGGYQMGHIECVKQNDLYLITYENQNDVQVNDYDEFSIKATDFDEVHKTIKTGFENKLKKAIQIPTVENYVELEYAKFLGKISARFTQSKKKGAIGVSFSAWYSQKEIDKLLGKK